MTQPAKTDSLAKIWLAPECPRCVGLDRSWCQDQQDDCDYCDCGKPWARYLLDPVQPERDVRGDDGDSE